jgi:hypothetical protein
MISAAQNVLRALRATTWSAGMKMAAALKWDVERGQKKPESLVFSLILLRGFP